MKVIERAWKKSAISVLHMIFHDDKSKIKKFIDEVFERDFKDTNIQLYNHYEDELINTRLSKIPDWIEAENPILTESGVFFKQKTKHRNLQAELIVNRIYRRKAIQKLEHAAKDEVERNFRKSGQTTVKLRLNSGYGIQSEPRSFAYSPHVPISITSAGRSQISISAALTENFFSDYVKFMNMDELYSYLLFFKKEYNTRTETENMYDYTEVIDRIPSLKDVVNRLESKFKDKTKFDREVVKDILKGFSVELLTRVYYKCNLSEFLLNKVMKELYQSIMDSETIFLDPNSVPEDIKVDVQLFAELVREFVHYDYIPFRYEDRNIMEERNVIIVEDTDSNIIYYDENLTFIEDNVITPKTKFDTGKEKFEYEQKLFNTLSYAHTVALRSGLDAYLTKINVPEEDFFWINMKNEFYMNTVVTTEGKKAYISNIVRQESRVFDEPELDTKGVTFYKSTATAKTSNFINNKILIEEILAPEDEKINLKRITKKINTYRMEIADDLQNGDMGYFSTSIRVKNAESYKRDPMSIAGFKAIFVWNHLAPREEQIQLPAFVSLIKVKLFKKQDVHLLEAFPDVYEKILELFETVPQIRDKGIKAIAVPGGTETIPEWILPIIDTETIINNNMALMAQIYGALDFVPGMVRHQSSQELKFYSSVLRL